MKPMAMNPQPQYHRVPPDEPRLREGLRLFSAGRFFESHEVWESLWHDVDGPEREPLQGLIQLAAAYHHWTRRNAPGSRYLLDRARQHLAAWQPVFAGIDVQALTDRAAGELTRPVAASGGREADARG